MYFRIPLYNRPTQRRSLERFNSILNTARRDLGSMGLEELTISNLAKRTDIGVHALYRYFPDIRGVFAYFLEEIYRELDSVLDDFIYRSKTTKNWEKEVSQFIKYFGLGVADRPYVTKTLLVCRVDPTLEAHWWRMVVAIEKRVSEWLRSMNYKSLGVPVSEMTRFIVVQVNGMVMELARSSEKDPMPSIREFQKTVISRLQRHISLEDQDPK